MGESSRSYAVAALELFSSYGDREAIVADDPMVAEDERRRSYRELAERIRSMAAMLWRQGLRPGSTIAVLAANPPSSIALQLAAHLVGCTTAWIAPNAPPPFRREFLQQARADLFIYEGPRFPNLSRSLTTGLDVAILTLGPGELGDDLAAAPSVDELPFQPGEIGVRPHSLFQTGGTTGEPKLVHHADGFFGTLIDQAQAYLHSGQPPLRHLLVAGTWHISSQLAAFITLLTGGTLLLQPGVENGAFLGLIERERVTSTLLTPPLLYALLDDPRLADADCTSLHTLTVSGSAAAPARLAQAIARFGPVLRITYGLSEAPFLTALPNLGVEPGYPQRLSSCGRPYGDAAIEIRDESGRPCAPGEPGEVWARGSLVMAGYWRQPALTAAAKAAGWLRTGDVGYLDADGYLYLVDRVSDMVVTGKSSTNVFCRPVEDALLSHPQVRAAAVIGVPDAEIGEAVHAYVTLTEDAGVTEDDLRVHVAARLNLVWAPASVEFVAELPLTEFGKVDKKALRARHQPRITEHPGPPG